MIAAAERAGKKVTSISTPDGVTLHFGKVEDTDTTNPNDDMANDDWKTPRAQAIPKEGYFKLEQGRYGPLFPRTPACHGFTIIAKTLPGTEREIREYGQRLEKALEADPHVLAPLQLPYLRWVLFNIGPDTYFMYQGIFDTDFDKIPGIRCQEP